MWHMDDGWGWWMVLNWIWIIGFWVLIFWAVRAFLGPGRDRTTARPRTGADALEILNRRYANGEITDEEYDRMRRRILGQPDTDLTGTGTGTGT